MDKLKEWLEKHNMSQRKFASELGISDAMVSLILKEERNLTRDMMVAIHRVTKGKITPNDLCGVRK